MKSSKIRIYASVASLVVLGAIIWLQRGAFTQGTVALTDANPAMIMAALVFSLIAVVPAAVVYQLIAVRRLLFGRTLLVQQASSFTGKLLPAGAGGMATIARYLVTQKHSVAQATSLVSVNNLASFIGINLLTVSSLLFSRKSIGDVVKGSVSTAIIWIVLGVICLVALLILWPNKSKKLTKAISEFWRTYKFALSNGWRFLGAIGFAMLITVCFVLSLLFSVRAFGAEINILQALVVLTIGVTAASITPTPGGLGGAELGLMAALRAVGLPQDVALPAALLYRFVSYWLPMIPGFIALQIALHKKYL